MQWQAIAPGQLGGQGARRLRLGRSEQPGLQLVARRPRREPRQRRGHAPAARGHRTRARCGPRRSPRATASATSRAPTSSGSSRARPRCATAGPSTAGSSGTSPTCRCGCSRRTRARASAARRTRRTSTAAWCAPPTRRSRPSTRPRPCSSAPSRRTARTPTKQNARTMPLAFIRSMGCVKVTLKRDRSGPCKGFKPLTGDGLAYHPHATTRAPDRAAAAILDKAAIADLPRLERTLDGTQRAGGLKKPAAASSASTSPNGATRRSRPTRSRASRWPSSRATCSRATTSPTRTRASSC